MAKKAKKELSGLFDFWKRKKKEGAQKGFFDVFKETAPSGLPALPSPQPEKRPVYEMFLPRKEERLPAKPAEPGALKPHEFFIKKEMIPRPKEALPAERPKPLQEVVPSFMKEPLSVPREMVEKIFAPPAEPPRYVFIQSVPPERRPPGKYELIVPGVSAVGGWKFPTVEELAQHFQKTMNLPALFDEVRRVRAEKQFFDEQLYSYYRGEPALIPIDPVVYQEMYTDFSKFYGIPWAVMDMFLSQPEGEAALWDNVLAPLNSKVADAFELLKPEDLPGFFTVSFMEPSMEYWIFYVEPLLKGPYET